MQSVNGTTITLTKGDTFKATIGITTPDGNPYVLQEGDSIRFAMKQSYEDPTPLIVKQVDPASMLLKLEPAETKGLETGTYVYDIQITYANGDVDTFIDRAKIKLTDEVE